MTTRVIEIDGVDSCACCGTHVRSTAELQAVKFVQTTKMRGHARLHFVVGDRLIELMQQLLLNDARVSASLGVNRAQQVATIDRVQDQLTVMRKQAKKMTDQLVALQAADILHQSTAGGTKMPQKNKQKTEY